MSKRSMMRFSEEQFRDMAVKRGRFGNASEYVETTPTLTDVVARKDTIIAPASPEGVGTDPKIPERDILKAVLAALTYHPRVAWAERMNVGAMQAGGRFVRFGFPGCSDIIGQLRDGRFLAVECKRAGKEPTEQQHEFLGRVHRAGGMAFVARSAADARNALNEYPEAA